MSPICGFKDYLTQRALDIADDEDLEIDIAARELLLIANHDVEALRRAEWDVGRRLLEHPTDGTARRAFRSLKRAVEVS